LYFDLNYERRFSVSSWRELLANRQEMKTDLCARRSYADLKSGDKRPIERWQEMISFVLDHEPSPGFRHVQRCPPVRDSQAPELFEAVPAHTSGS